MVLIDCFMWTRPNRISIACVTIMSQLQVIQLAASMAAIFTIIRAVSAYLKPLKVGTKIASYGLRICSIQHRRLACNHLVQSLPSEISELLCIFDLCSYSLCFIGTPAVLLRYSSKMHCWNGLRSKTKTLWLPLLCFCYVIEHTPNIFMV